ncbi:MAG: DNA-processing protein DprA [Oscillospiraceae bacterium]|nr:DNA-processing protein DprA [Oscillospiraceae bacterium]
MQSLKYWVWLSTINGIGAMTAMRLLNHFGSPENVFMADLPQYLKVPDIKPGDAARLSDKSLDGASLILAECAECGCRIVTFRDEEYSERLRNIYDPPIVLYVRGHLPDIDGEPIVSIVGSRDCTPYGIGAAESISHGLASRGVIVATGLARGIDSAAVRGAMLGGGRVIGVVGTGLDVVYPPENVELFDDVANYGAIISEYPPKTPPAKNHFPARNRIISGISLGVAVIEAPKRSGALITAARALEQGRDVFSLPGNVDARSCEGSNALLRDGAIPILSAEDIISEYAELFPDKISEGGKPSFSPDDDADKHRKLRSGQAVSDAAKKIVSKKEIDKQTGVEYIDLNEIIDALDGDEGIVANTIKANSVHIDEIIQNSGLPPQQVLTAITMLEIKGAVVQSGGKYYSLAKPE